MFIVICRSDREGRKAGPYVLATRTVFAHRNEAERYKRTVSKSRQPLVVEGRWTELRPPAHRNGLTVENGVILENPQLYPFDTCFSCGGAVNLRTSDTKGLILCDCPVSITGNSVNSILE